jgi:hypothetical protein
LGLSDSDFGPRDWTPPPRLFFFFWLTGVDEAGPTLMNSKRLRPSDDCALVSATPYRHVLCWKLRLSTLLTVIRIAGPWGVIVNVVDPVIVDDFSILMVARGRDQKNVS